MSADAGHPGRRRGKRKSDSEDEGDGTPKSKVTYVGLSLMLYEHNWLRLLLWPAVLKQHRVLIY